MLISEDVLAKVQKLAHGWDSEGPAGCYGRAMRGWVDPDRGLRCEALRETWSNAEHVKGKTDAQ